MVPLTEQEINKQLDAFWERMRLRHLEEEEAARKNAERTKKVLEYKPLNRPTREA